MKRPFEQDPQSSNKKTQNNETSTQLDQNSAEHFYNLGVSYFKSKQLQEALASLKKATELAPTNASYFNQLGTAHFKSDQYQEAITQYTKATQLDLTTAEYFNNLGNVYSELGQHQKAITQYTKATKLAPGESLYKMNSGESIMDFSETTGIENNKLIKLAMSIYADAGEEGEQYVLDFCHKTSHQPSFMQLSAIKMLSPQEIALKKNALPVLKGMGDKYFEQKAYLKALEAFDTFLNIQPHSFSVLVAAKIAATKSLELPAASIVGLFRATVLSPQVPFDDNNITTYLQYKIKEYHLEATRFLPLYAKLLVQILKSHDIYEIGILNKILSFIMPDQTLESIKAPGEILKLLGESPSIHIEELQEPMIVEIAGNLNETHE